MRIVRNTIEMNYCSDRHDHLYKITYRAPHTNMQSPEWNVCDWCFQKKCFSNLEEVKMISKILN